ncbi:MAG TPA: 16S rRNA (guanine(966)-N(2))-methyltransferase RsmD [Vicinamibacterales bacterium]|nr:16S rRNA (guanine(966)-N(2))-methyltransferase RsmD [Vicinamibacterales bacterium]
MSDLRVIAGHYKGRTLKAPTWDGLRPTSDRLRETLFNVLAPRIRGARVLDVYAGTGAVGIEALSRGATAVTFVDHDRRAQELIAWNLAHCGIADGYAIIRATASHALEQLRRGRSGATFDLVLLDPPYDHPAAEALAGVDALVAPDGLVVLEHARRAPVPESIGRLTLTRDLVSGDSALALYACQP